MAVLLTENQRLDETAETKSARGSVLACSKETLETRTKSSYLFNVRNEIAF